MIKRVSKSNVYVKEISGGDNSSVSSEIIRNNGLLELEKPVKVSQESGSRLSSVLYGNCHPKAQPAQWSDDSYSSEWVGKQGFTTSVDPHWWGPHKAFAVAFLGSRFDPLCLASHGNCSCSADSLVLLSYVENIPVAFLLLIMHRTWDNFSKVRCQFSLIITSLLSLTRTCSLFIPQINQIVLRHHYFQDSFSKEIIIIIQRKGKGNEIRQTRSPKRCFVSFLNTPLVARTLECRSSLHHKASAQSDYS